MGERLTTPKAEKRTGASRWALLRAQKAGALVGQRDNRGRWFWDTNDLDKWMSARPDVETPQETQERPAEAEALMEARERAARAEGERDGLREALSEARSRAEAAEQRAQAAENEAARLREDAAGRRWRWPWYK